MLTPERSAIAIPPRPWVFQLLDRFASWSDDRKFWVLNALCAPLALFAIWGHAYPAGIDLPQHANIFYILAHYDDPGAGYRFFYRMDFFTPYAAVYAIGWPLAWLAGGTFATKCVLTLAVMLLPVGLWTWLRESGGERLLAILGYVVAFGFGYQWGFVSFLFSLQASCFYLAAATRLRRIGGIKNLALASGLAVYLFFCHGATFTLIMAASGVATLFQRSLRKVAFDLLHFIAPAMVLVPWYLGQQRNATGRFADFPKDSRFLSLLSGLFSTTPTFQYALATFLIALFILALGRPILATSPLRYFPAALGLIGLLSVPDWVGETWLVGTRFVHFVYVYALGAFDFLARGTRRVVLVLGAFAITVAGLGWINQRLAVFNEELAPLFQLTKKVPKKSDVYYVRGNWTSKTFGDGQFGQVASWLTADQGGFLENDSGGYWNNPIQRRSDFPWPSEFHYRFHRGARASYSGEEHVAARDGYHLYKTRLTSIEMGGLKLVRFSSKGGKPALSDVTLGGENRPSIRVKGTMVLQMQAKEDTRRLTGQASMTDDGGRFRVLNKYHEVLWASPEGSSLAKVDADLTGTRGEVFLVFESPAGSGHWVDLNAH